MTFIVEFCTRTEIILELSGCIVYTRRPVQRKPFTSRRAVHSAPFEVTIESWIFRKK